MKKRILLLTIVLTLIFSILAVPTAFADSQDIDNSLEIVEATTTHRVIDLTRVNGPKTIDIFKGESVTLKVDILVKKPIVIENEDSIKATYIYDDAFEMSVKRGAELPNGGKYDSGNAYLRREEVTLTAKEDAKPQVYQVIAEYEIAGKPYFNSVELNVLDKANAVESMTLSPKVTTLKNNQQVDFDLLINGSSTLDISDTIVYKINNEVVSSLKGYLVNGSCTSLDIEISYVDNTGKNNTFTSKIPVTRATALAKAELNSESCAFLLSDEQGKIKVYATRDSYPNINVFANSVKLNKVEKVGTTQNELLDVYELTLDLVSATDDEEILVSVDQKHMTCNVAIIDKVVSVAIVPTSTKFESNKPATFNVVINGIKNVDTHIKWTVNGIEDKSNANSLTYKSISNNDIKVTAEVGGIIAEYNYKIDNSMNSIILTVVVSLVVIIICIPILIALKKSPKPNLKAMITKDNTATIAKLNKLKDDINGDETKSMLKRILKLNTIITRSEKRAQQESFECENKAFGAALAKLGEAKSLCSDLLATYKTNPKDVSINIIDNIIFCLESCNETIKKVEDNM